MRTIILFSYVDQNSRAKSGLWSPEHGCWLHSGAGCWRVGLWQEGVYLYSLALTEREKEAWRTGVTTFNSLEAPWSQGGEGRNLKRKERISSPVSASSSLDTLCFQCPNLAFCRMPFFLQGFERTEFWQIWCSVAKVNWVQIAGLACCVCCCLEEDRSETARRPWDLLSGLPIVGSQGDGLWVLPSVYGFDVI